ncbi:MAG TPA: LUD domain-containing protein [Tepidisphaeraceae bacterium]|nr:LUD domain-containing protein [Tepidisphaeraceae bacterium]
MRDQGDVIESVRRALGRTSPLTVPPVPPVIDEPIVRLVQSDIGLAELFARVASENKMGVTPVSPDELADQLVAFLRKNRIKSVAMTISPLLKSLGIYESIRQAGVDVRTWNELQLDRVYDIDCGITDVWAAVAEVGGLVIRGTVDHGRAVSLVPAFHVAIVEPKNLVADLVDLFQKIPPDQNDKFVIITGPSKTADIEMNLVTGVHGPGMVQVFLLQ